MARRRMLSRDIFESDSFLDLSQDARMLYTYLILRADDDGFITSPKTTMRMIEASADALEELENAGYIITFQSGATVIRHWLAQNKVKSDRYTPTTCTDEKALLSAGENGIYSIRASPEPERIHDGSIVDPQYRLGQDSIVQYSSGQGSSDQISSDQDSSGVIDILLGEDLAVKRSEALEKAKELYDSQMYQNICNRFNELEENPQGTKELIEMISYSYKKGKDQ